MNTNKTTLTGTQELELIINNQKKEREMKMNNLQTTCYQKLLSTKEKAFMHHATGEYYDLGNACGWEAEREYLQMVCYLWGKEFMIKATQEYCYDELIASRAKTIKDCNKCCLECERHYACGYKF